MRLRCRIGIHRCPSYTGTPYNTRCLECGQLFAQSADNGKFNLTREERQRQRRMAREARW